MAGHRVVVMHKTLAVFVGNLGMQQQQQQQLHQTIHLTHTVFHLVHSLEDGIQWAYDTGEAIAATALIRYVDHGFTKHHNAR